MKVLGHPDPAVLEQELLARLATLATRAPLAGALVVVPTARLGEHLQRRLAASRPAWLGVEVLHFRALARRIANGGSRHAMLPLSPRLLQALVRKLLRRQPDSVWSVFVDKRPRALGGLIAALRDLREAGISPRDLDACCAPSPRDRDLAALYRDYSAALEGLAARGHGDEAALVRASLPRAADYARSFGAIFLHGAYELIGVHLELLRELDRARGVTVLLPARPQAPVSEYATSFAKRHLLADRDRLEEIADTAARDRGRLLCALYDEHGTTDPAPSGLFALRHTQGAAAEVRVAVREALRAIDEGCPPGEIAIAARGLAPYAPFLEETFAREDLPWVSSVSTPLRRHPAIHDLMLMLDVLDRDFPRQATVELLRSPRVRWRSLVGQAERPSGDRADRWSRQSGIVGGLDEWVRDLPAWAAEPRLRGGESDEERAEEERRAEDRAGHARRIGRALTALRRRARAHAARTWSAHAEHLRTLLELIREEEDDRDGAAFDVLRGLLDEMRALESVLDEHDEVPFGRVVVWLSEAIDGAELPLQREDHGGIRVLDAMQLRGLTFERLFLLGLNSGQFPHPPREDPVLPDDLRRALRERTGRPLPVKAEGRHEERLLLSLLLGSARERIDVSWQRADESGRARSPSLALRELARLVLGVPDMERLIAGATHVPSHPAQFLEALSEGTDLLAPAEERLLTILRAKGPVIGLDACFPDLSPGLEMLRATESFGAPQPAYDARVGALQARTLSVSALETLGRCPLQYFFRCVLGVRELDAQAAAFETEARDLGQRIHALLERIYRGLGEEGRFESGDAQALVARALELAESAWPEAMGELGRRLGGRAPVLWELLRARWSEAVEAFLAQDLPRIVEERLGRPQLETPVEARIELGPGVGLDVRGRFDRRFDSAGRTRVGDYKTGKVGKRADVTEMLKARSLQVPLYWLLAGSATTVELLPVGPSAAGDGDSSERRATFSGFDDETQASGFLETLRVVVALAERGVFPLNEGGHCDWCPYEPACRRTHPPTLERESRAADSEDYRLLAEKNKTRKPTLALVRPGREDDGGGDG